MKNIVKKVLLSVSLFLIVTSTTVYAKELNLKQNPKYVRQVKNLRSEVIQLNAKEGRRIQKNQIDMFYINCDIPSIDAPIDMDEYGRCKNGCYHIFEIYSAYLKEDGNVDYYDYRTVCLDCTYSHACAVFPEESNDPKLKALVQLVGSEKTPKKEVVVENKHAKNIREKQQWLLDNGVNNRAKTNEFKVYDENGNIYTSDLLIKEPMKEVDSYGICKDGKHRTICYYTHQAEFLVFVSQCFDCTKQRITNVESIDEEMNMLGTANKVKENIEVKEEVKQEVEKEEVKQEEVVKEEVEKEEVEKEEIKEEVKEEIKEVINKEVKQEKKSNSKILIVSAISIITLGGLGLAIYKQKIQIKKIFKKNKK